MGGDLPAGVDHVECPRCGAWYEWRTNLLDGEPYLFPSCRHKVTANWPPVVVEAGAAAR